MTDLQRDTRRLTWKLLMLKPMGVLVLKEVRETGAMGTMEAWLSKLFRYLNLLFFK